MRKKLQWATDYLHMFRGQAIGYFHREPPRHYLDYTVEGKHPVILVPGLASNWGFLKGLGDKISLSGHPIYIVPQLGYNFLDIPTSAKIVRRVIDENNLEYVIIVAHSKGGLIGKYLLVYHNIDKRISGVVAIATPFSGSSLGRFLPHRSYEEISTGSKLLKDLESHTKVNSQITSIFPASDQHVRHPNGSFLNGAENVEIPVHGHHKIVFDTRTQEKVFEVIEKLSKKVR